MRKLEYMNKMLVILPDGLFLYTLMPPEAAQTFLDLLFKEQNLQPQICSAQQ
jgi:hypothetical protein